MQVFWGFPLAWSTNSQAGTPGCADLGCVSAKALNVPGRFLDCRSLACVSTHALFPVKRRVNAREGA